MVVENQAIFLNSGLTTCFTCDKSCDMCLEPTLKNSTQGFCQQNLLDIYLSPWTVICPGIFLLLVVFYGVFLIVTEITLTSIRREREIYTKPSYSFSKFSKFSKSTGSKPSINLHENTSSVVKALEVAAFSGFLNIHF